MIAPVLGSSARPGPDLKTPPAGPFSLTAAVPLPHKVLLAYEIVAVGVDPTVIVDKADPVQLPLP
jgi:hypothetical protein